MTKLERARQAVEQLPEDMQDRLADYISRYVDAYRSLHKDILAGARQLDAGKKIAAEDVIARIKELYRT